MPLATEKKRRCDEWTLPISRAELQMKLRRRIGKSQKYRPKPGTEKSTKICIYDIALLAKVCRAAINNFLRDKPHVPGYSTMGQKTLARLNDVLDRVNGGYITKTQHGKYHYWDTPQLPPVRTGKIDLDSLRILGVVSTPKIQRMPSFSTVFGSK